jgi:6-phosphogluconate dehydrogenase
MKFGIVGLGRMGGNMMKRLERDGHEAASFARSGGGTAGSLEELVGQLEPKRPVWLMIPAGDPTEQTVNELLGLLEPGDIVIDGGNSNFRDSQRRAALARERGIGYVDAGVSGGIWGMENGYCIMAGGEREDVSHMEPLFHSLSHEGGYAHVGPPGAGHFVKMVHNGIEYGLMQAYAEGFDIFRNASSEALEDDYRYDLDLAEIAELWRRGSVVGSWLLDLTASALLESPDLSEYTGFVQDSGEGRWTVQAAIDEAVPADVLTAALYTRFRSRQEHTFAEKVLSAMRNKFGGHVETPVGR